MFGYERLFRFALPAGAASGRVEEGVAHDGVQPGRERRLIPEQFQALVDLDQGFLREVVAVGVRAREGSGEPAHLAEMAGQQRLERADVAVLRLRDQRVELFAASHSREF